MHVKRTFAAAFSNDWYAPKADLTRPAKPDLDESGRACTCGADQSSNLQFHQGLPAEAQAAISQIWQSSKTRLNAGSVREAHLF